MPKVFYLGLIILLSTTCVFAKTQKVHCEENGFAVDLEIDDPRFTTLLNINGNSANERARLYVNGERMELTGINVTNSRKSISFSGDLTIQLLKNQIGVEFERQEIYVLQTIYGVGTPKYMLCSSTLRN